MNAGTRSDHNTFCQTEKWVLVRDAQGRPVRHHVTYELPLPDGRILRTRISRPVDKTTYGPALWRSILRDQPDVGEEAFWACVRHKQLPERGGPPAAPPETSLPTGLVHQLIHVAGVSEHEITTMTLAQALARMNDHWSRER